MCFTSTHPSSCKSQKKPKMKAIKRRVLQRQKASDQNELSNGKIQVIFSIIAAKCLVAHHAVHSSVAVPFDVQVHVDGVYVTSIPYLVTHCVA